MNTLNNAFNFKPNFINEPNTVIPQPPPVDACIKFESYPNMLYSHTLPYSLPTYTTPNPKIVQMRPLLDTPANYEYYNYTQQTIRDQAWLDSWISQNNNMTTTTKITPNVAYCMKIGEAKLTLQKCLHILSNLKNTESLLTVNINSMSNLSWEQKLIEIDKQKANLLNLLTPFDNVSTIQTLKSNLKKRKLRRAQIHREKRYRKDYWTSVHEKRRKAHDTINQWLEEQKDNVEKVKREEYLKRDADCVLSEVTKKKTDARRQLALLSSLVKLRNVREKAAEGRGEKFSLEDTDTFRTITDRLKNMWERALKTYGVEEQGLKLMLDHKSGNPSTRLVKNRDIVNEWKLAIFGPKLIPCDAYWVLTCAWKDLETFVAIRKSWDTFLTSPKNVYGSSIPIGWVLPCESSSQEWTTYLEKPQHGS